MSREENIVEAMNKFKEGGCNILLGTDVVTRGLYIPFVDMVINYDLPINPKDYILQVDRAIGAGKSGVGISLVSDSEEYERLQIEKLIGKKLPEFPVQKEHCTGLPEPCHRSHEVGSTNRHKKLHESGGGKGRRRKISTGRDKSEVDFTVQW
ncbi:hypothetical protein C5167_014310 [Papaver somniferum]|uniref:Helicase C-terminal domain-containing protein n=1 Tax=Papaver somniferum TaxID=3469 RepID=A0A4Y7J6V5_PAPSO|nr:hypothetical protein C5167_014310 [Papaver somniferum]